MMDPTLSPWQTLDDAAATTLPAELRLWMTLATSMTAQLRHSAGADVTVDVLRSEVATVDPDERRCFADSPERAQVREVCLHGGGRALLAARTVYASARLQADPVLAGLGDRPLGELLFDGTSAARWTLREFARLTPGSPLHALAQRCAPQAHDAFWARRTLFWRAGEPLLVTEIFLPPVLPIR